MKKFDPSQMLEGELPKDFELNFHKEFIKAKSVLGIDIYKYSEYPLEKQVYVPVLFNKLYELTVVSYLAYEQFFLQNYGKDLVYFQNHFISTGDGGFQMFNNPLQSILFAAYFQLNVRTFNSGNMPRKIFENLFKIVGRIELRYAITFDQIYSYENNFFGTAIINNARILAKDHLNRMLIDFNTIDWFDKNIHTIENLLIMKQGDFLKTKYFNSYDGAKSSLFFGPPHEIIKAIDVLKIGNIKSKNTPLDIYNLRIQFNLENLELKDIYSIFLVTLGNLNTQGIE
jgi:hypothetical protein